jgi:hypothetical protein
VIVIQTTIIGRLPARVSCGVARARPSNTSLPTNASSRTLPSVIGWIVSLKRRVAIKRDPSLLAQTIGQQLTDC